ncbi:unnamed protein product [Ixodes persulcatus]
MARVTISGPFGKLETEAAVSKNMPQSCPYLFSDKSDQMLREKGLAFSERTVHALTRARARQITAEAACPREESNSGEPELAENEHPLFDTVNDAVCGPDFEPGVSEAEGDRALRNEQEGSELDNPGGHQQRDLSLKQLRDTVREGVSRKNISFYERARLLYRTYRDRKGRLLDQLVVPQRYR